MTAKFLATCLSLFMVSCSTPVTVHEPRQYLDPQTAATVTMMESPFVFSQEHVELAANVRDYANVAAVVVNQSGKVSYFLLTYLWSTVDRRVASSHLQVQRPVLLADDRTITLQTKGLNLLDAGLHYAPHHPNADNATESIAVVDLDTLRYLSNARHLRFRIGGDADQSIYELWNDQRESLLALVHHMGG